MPDAARSMESEWVFSDAHELALRRCGSKPARFVEVYAHEGDPTHCLRRRIRETGVAATVQPVHVGPGGARLDTAARISNESLDFVFINVGRDFLSVRNAIREWWPKLRPGGLFAGSGYGHSTEIAAAVDGFVTIHQLARAFRTSDTTWMIYKSLRIDAAYCISLRHRTDRRASATGQFRAAGMQPPVWFFDAVDGKQLRHPGVVSDGQAGCAASHLQLLQAAALRGHRHVLIFEDDVELVDGFMSRFDSALARCPASYDLLYIGACCHPHWGTYLYPFDDLLARAGRVYGAHAYVVNVDTLPEIDTGLRELEVVNDQWYANVLQPRSNCYVCVPYLAHQQPGYSDISNGYNNERHYWSHYVWR